MTQDIRLVQFQVVTLHRQIIVILVLPILVLLAHQTPEEVMVVSQEEVLVVEEDAPDKIFRELLGYSFWTN